jgi:hypothetical protein
VLLLLQPWVLLLQLLPASSAGGLAGDASWGRLMVPLKLQHPRNKKVMGTVELEVRQQLLTVINTQRHTAAAAVRATTQTGERQSWRYGRKSQLLTVLQTQPAVDAAVALIPCALCFVFVCRCSSGFSAYTHISRYNMLLCNAAVGVLPTLPACRQARNDGPCQVQASYFSYALT